MHRFAILLVCLASCLALAQDSPRAEIFAGYSFASIDTNGLSNRQSVPDGLNLSFVGNFNPWVGAETNAAAYYKKISGVGVYNYSLAFGPRFHYRWAFVHVLFGMDDLVGKGFGLKASQASPAGAIGGGAIFKLSRYIGVEGGADYVLSHHNIVGGPGIDQNNFRASAGIVFTLGGNRAHRKESSVPVPALEGSAVGNGHGIAVASLGVTVISGSNRGAEVVQVLPNSAAALAGLHPNDVINSVDGKPVRTAMELAAELSGKGQGQRIRLGYLVRGQWQTETVILLP
jgi:hypothetical protein